MRHFLFLLLFTFILTAVAGQAGEEKPMVLLHSEGGRFSVTFPMKPKKHVAKVATSAGECELRGYYVLGDIKDTLYLTTYFDLPKGTITDANRQTIFDERREADVKSAKGKLITEKKITLGEKKIEGREYLIERPAVKGHDRGRIYIKGDRVYQVYAVGPGDWAKSNAVTKYLDSFEIEE